MKKLTLAILVGLLFPNLLFSGIQKIEYLVDPSRELNLDSVMFGEYKNEFTEANANSLNFGFLDAGLWLRISPQISPEFSTAYLEFKNPNLDLIEVSYIIGPEVYKLKPAGDQFLFGRREIDHRYYQFELSHAPDRIRTIYVYIDNIGDQLFIPIELEGREEILQRDYYLQYFNGLYFGVLFFVLLLNLFMYFSLRERTNLYYVLYIFGLAILQLSLEGYGFEYLWPDSVYLSNHANPIFATFSVLFLLQFSREFLALKDYLPKFDRIFRYTAYLLVITLVCALPNIRWTYQFSILSINTLAFLLNIVIIPIGIYMWIKGYKAARFFVIAFVILVLAVFVFILRNFGSVPNSLLTEKSLQIGSSFEVILLSLAIVDKFRIFKDQAYDRLQEINEMKSRANIVLEQKVDERTRELVEQKELVEVKNKEITESIEYAKRIQTGLLPSNALFSKLMGESFVLYKPKDIVSGDFYWIDEIAGKVFFAAVDCTGHGVPGAMVSVLGFNHLNRCMHEHNLLQPGEILDKLSELMISSFRKSELTIYDGMDIALCSYDPKSKELNYAGANNPLYLVRSGELEEIKGTKKPVGYSDKSEKFENHVLKLKKDDWIYVFSDGYADQFGGPKNKKFKYRELKDLLLSINDRSPEDQCKVLDKRFEEWRGSNAQLDDVCMIGLKVT